MTKRLICFGISIILIITSCVGRIAYIMFSNSYKASDSRNSYTLVLDNNDVNLYYRNMKRITNSVTKKVAVIRPNKNDISECYKIFNGDELNGILEELKYGKPVVKTVENDFVAKSIQSYFIRVNDNNCNQLISKSSSGLLKHIKSDNASLKLRFKVDANGRLLSGDKGELINEKYYTAKGLKLTIDSDIQNIAIDSCESLKSGCVVICDVKTGELLACVTKPDDSFLFKPAKQYSVGSVFKIDTALSALENGIDITYNCKGHIKVGDTDFSCQNEKAHGKQNLKEALANSCNCYFVKLSQKLSAGKIIETAKKLGFNSTTELYNGWNIKNGSLPDNSIYNSKGRTALLAFGQGELTATPLQIASLICTVADNGVKKNIKLVLGEVNEDLSITDTDTKRTQCVNSKYCKTLSAYLRYAVQHGTGNNADYNNKSAGKTATAQTGQYKNGRELLNTWFAGFYPYNNPKYAIVVMCEEGTSGSENCCPVFRTIVEKLDNM